MDLHQTQLPVDSPEVIRPSDSEPESPYILPRTPPCDRALRSSRRDLFPSFSESARRRHNDELGDLVNQLPRWMTDRYADIEKLNFVLCQKTLVNFAFYLTGRQVVG